MKTTVVLKLHIGVFAALLVATGAFAQDYTVTDLGTLGGDESEAHAVNDKGQVVGWSRLPHDPTYGGQPQHAFIYDQGTISDLGTLGGHWSTAHGINNTGWVVGRSQITTGTGVIHAFLYRDGAMYDLGTLGGTNSLAYDINEKGDIVGYSNTASGGTHAFLYSNGVMRDLGTLGSDFSVAYAINDNGVIAGWSQDASNVVHGFRYSAGTMLNLGRGGYGYDIDNKDQVVGVISIPSASAPLGDPRAFLYDGSIQNLGTLGGNFSEADGINERGKIVGHSQISGANYAAFLYESGTMTDLNTVVPAGTAMKLRQAHDINESDQIVGLAISDFKYRAFLLEEKKGRWPFSAWYITYAAMNLNDENIALLRRYRDEILNKTATGRHFTMGLYQRSTEVLKVLLENPELMESAKYLFDQNEKNLRKVVNGGQAELSAPNQLLSFLDEFSSRSPRKLGQQIYRIKNEMLTKQSRGEEFMGFRLKQ
jgi:probable HAF family extracellular repeat protein